MELARHVLSIQNRKLVICLQYFKKKVSQLLLSYFVMHNIEIFCRDPVLQFLKLKSCDLKTVFPHFAQRGFSI